MTLCRWEGHQSGCMLPATTKRRCPSEAEPVLHEPWTAPCCSRTRSDRRPARRGSALTGGRTTAVARQGGGLVREAGPGAAARSSRPRRRGAATGGTGRRRASRPGAEPGGVGVGDGAVVADDLQAQGIGQSGAYGLGRAVGQQVNRAAGLDVDEDGGVDVALTQGELVDVLPDPAPRVPDRAGRVSAAGA